MLTRPRVVVLGGGFAGLESAFYLRHRLQDKVEISLISDQSYFTFKPNTIYVPFGADPNKLRIDLEPPMKKKQIDFVLGRVEDIDTARRVVHLHDFEMPFDYLVVATGAAMRPEEIPGLAENSVTIWNTDDMLRLRDAFAKLVEHAKQQRQRLLFVLPPNNQSAGPLYEMVMMTDTWLREQNMRGGVDITWATYEGSYLQVFGPRLNSVVADEFAERGITGRTRHELISVQPGCANFAHGESLCFDLLVSFPPYAAAVKYSMLPSDERGFIKVDASSRRVDGFNTIFAVGDASNFPVKQAFLSLLEADAAADHIAADILHQKPEIEFEPTSMYLMEEMNKATFAQIPFNYTGDPNSPVAVATEDDENYRVGISPLWRVGKKAIGVILPWRFGHGEPFHAGLAGGAMDFGVKLISKVLST